MYIASIECKNSNAYIEHYIMKSLLNYSFNNSHKFTVIIKMYNNHDIIYALLILQKQCVI